MRSLGIYTPANLVYTLSVREPNQMLLVAIVWLRMLRTHGTLQPTIEADGHQPVFAVGMMIAAPHTDTLF